MEVLQSEFFLALHLLAMMQIRGEQDSKNPAQLYWVQSL
jgi:hypothetical protein